MRTASAGEVVAVAVALVVDAAVAGVVPRGASIAEMGAGTGTPGSAGAIGVANARVERTVCASSARPAILAGVGRAGVAPVLNTAGAGLFIASGLTSTCRGTWGRVSTGLTGCREHGARAEVLTERETPVPGVAAPPRLGVTLLRGWVGASSDCALAEAFMEEGEVERSRTGSGTSILG